MPVAPRTARCGVDSRVAFRTRCTWSTLPTTTCRPSWSRSSSQTSAPTTPRTSTGCCKSTTTPTTTTSDGPHGGRAGARPPVRSRAAPAERVEQAQRPPSVTHYKGVDAASPQHDTPETAQVARRAWPWESVPFTLAGDCKHDSCQRLVRHTGLIPVGPCTMRPTVFNVEQAQRNTAVYYYLLRSGPQRSMEVGADPGSRAL